MRLRSFAILLATLMLPASRSDALTFEPPVPVAADATTDDPGRSGLNPVAATNGTGTWVVAWQQDGSFANPPPDLIGCHCTLDIFFARSTDGGLSFGPQMPLNTDAGSVSSAHGFTSVVQNQQPALAAHGNRFIAVWTRLFFGEVIALARSDDGGATWAPPAVLYDRSVAPAVATDGAGTWIIAWQYQFSLSQSQIYFARSVDDGATWSVPIVLNSASANDAYDDLGPSVFWSHGVWLIAWTGRVGSDGAGWTSEALYSRSTDGGATWSDPARIDGGTTTNGSAPRLASDGAGNWVAVWLSTGAASTGNTLAARSSDDGLTWSAPALIDPVNAVDGHLDSSVDVAAGAPGTYVAVWGRQPSPSANHIDSMWSASTDGGATWSPPVPLNPHAAAAATNFEFDYGSRVAFDPAGYFFALWTSNDATLASGTKGGDFDPVMALAGNPCGNGVLDPGEQCDDGDRGSLDCCGRTCAYDPPDTACAADADPCTLERCDGAGACLHVNAPRGTHCAADDDVCTFDRCDGNDVCEHVFEPQTGCYESLASHAVSLYIRAGAAGQSQLKWKWKRGPARVPFATYLYGANYSLCLYDGTGLIGRYALPVDASCAGDTCWIATNKGYKYLDRDGTPDGVTKLIFKRGKATSVSLKAQGVNFVPPSLPIMSTPIHAQLSSDEGVCLDSVFSTGIKVNTGTTFGAKSD